MNLRTKLGTSRFVLLSLSLAAVGLTITATMLSPLFLEYLATNPTARWDQLSNIGQTYGAASAVLSAFALVSIGASLVLQAREMRYSRELAERAHHLNLMKLHFEHPELVSAHRLPSELDPHIQIYHNLLLSYWETLYEVGRMSDAVLTVYVSRDLFNTDTGRLFWERSREYRLSVPKSRRTARFVSTVDTVWHEAMAAERRKVPEPTASSSAMRAAALFKKAATAMAIGGGIWWALRTGKGWVRD